MSFFFVHARACARLGAGFLVTATPLHTFPCALFHHSPTLKNQVINAAELASYDVCKSALTDAGAPGDSILTHLAAGLGAGFFAVCCGSPVDVVKSRMMGMKRGRERAREAVRRKQQHACRLPWRAPAPTVSVR